MGKADGVLDLTHIDRRRTLDRKLEGILEIYEKFVGDDPREVPMKIFPRHALRTMGGLWVDFNADDERSGGVGAGEADSLDPWSESAGKANSPLSCIYGGFVAGPGNA